MKTFQLIFVTLIAALVGCTQNATLLDDIAKTQEPTGTAAGSAGSDPELAKKLRSIWIVGGTRTAGQPAAAVAVGAMAANLDYYDPETNTWGTVTSSSWSGTFAPRLGAGYAGHNGKIYVIGGYGEGTSVANALTSNLVQIYDIATNTWSTGANLPAAVASPAVAKVGSRIYVWSGSSGANASAFTAATTHYVYNISANTWSTGTAPTAAQAGSEMCMVSDGVALWKIGGKTAAATVAAIASYIPINISSSPFTNGGVTFSATGMTVRTGAVCYFAPATSSLPPRLYLVGGYSAIAVNTTPLSPLTTGTATTTLANSALSQVVAAPYTGAWTGTPNLPVASANAAGIIKSGVMYYFGGNTFNAATAGAGNVNWSSSEPSATVYAADPEIGFWQNRLPNTTTTIPDMPTPRWGHGAVTVH